ncbi:MAG: DUF853 domain-containing protein, partial [Pseudomonadota bacterium]|nr:DUF853 domain-containing protein [Pseudomonadota bacterium]
MAGWGGWNRFLPEGAALAHAYSLGLGSRLKPQEHATPMASQPSTNIFIGSGPAGARPQVLELARANRHGLIAGATGTG